MKEKLEAVEEDRNWLEKQLKQSKKYVCCVLQAVGCFVNVGFDTLRSSCKICFDTFQFTAWCDR